MLIGDREVAVVDLLCISTPVGDESAEQAVAAARPATGMEIRKSLRCKTVSFSIRCTA
jgi:hypothetical protein